MIGTGPQPPATHRSASSISRRMTSSSTLVRGSSCASPHPGWFRVSSCPRAGWRRFTSSIHHTLRIHRQQLMLCPSLWARRFTASILLSPTLDRARCTSRAVHLPSTSPSGLILSGPTTSSATRRGVSSRHVASPPMERALHTALRRVGGRANESDRCAHADGAHGDRH